MSGLRGERKQEAHSEEVRKSELGRVWGKKNRPASMRRRGRRWCFIVTRLGSGSGLTVLMTTGKEQASELGVIKDRWVASSAREAGVEAAWARLWAEG